MTRKSSVWRLMELLVDFASCSEHIGNVENSQLLRNIVADPKLAPMFRCEVLASLKHNNNPEDRSIVANILLAAVDTQAAQRNIRRAIMQEFVIHLADYPSDRVTHLTDDLESAKERLMEEGFTPQEIADREKRFHKWLEGE